MEESEEFWLNWNDTNGLRTAHCTRPTWCNTLPPYAQAFYFRTLCRLTCNPSSRLRGISFSSLLLGPLIGLHRKQGTRNKTSNMALATLNRKKRNKKRTGFKHIETATKMCLTRHCSELNRVRSLTSGAPESRWLRKIGPPPRGVGSREETFTGRGPFSDPGPAKSDELLVGSMETTTKIH